MTKANKQIQEHEAHELIEKTRKRYKAPTGQLVELWWWVGWYNAVDTRGLKGIFGTKIRILQDEIKKLTRLLAFIIVATILATAAQAQHQVIRVPPCQPTYYFTTQCPRPINPGSLRAVAQDEAHVRLAQYQLNVARASLNAIQSRLQAQFESQADWITANAAVVQSQDKLNEVTDSYLLVDSAYQAALTRLNNASHLLEALKRSGNQSAIAQAAVERMQCSVDATAQKRQVEADPVIQGAMIELTLDKANLAQLQHQWESNPDWVRAKASVDAAQQNSIVAYGQLQADSKAVVYGY